MVDNTKTNLVQVNTFFVIYNDVIKVLCCYKTQM